MTSMDDLEPRVAALETIVASLRARQNDHRGELARVADAVADIRVVQAEHSDALVQLSADVAVLTGGFEVQNGMLNEHGLMLREILRRLPGES